MTETHNPTVYVGKEKYAVLAELYEDFLSECVAGDTTLSEYLASLIPGAEKALSAYIIHRLAEVDPGFLRVAA